MYRTLMSRPLMGLARPLAQLETCRMNPTLLLWIFFFVLFFLHQAVPDGLVTADQKATVLT